MSTGNTRRSYDWHMLMIAAALLMIRLVLRLTSGPPDLSQSPTAERLTFFFDIVLVVVLTVGLFTLPRLLQGREQSRILTITAFSLGLISGVILLFIGD